MTNEEMNDMFNKNINIAYKIANRYRINYPEEYEDIKQIALLGLWKAIQQYNSKWALTTIAYKIIFSNINFYLRSVKKHKENDFSIQTIVCEDDKSELTIEDLIPDNNNQIENMLCNIDIQDAFNKLNPNDIESKVLDLRRQGLSQREIGIQLNRSQAQISRIETKIKLRFKCIMNGEYCMITPHKCIKETTQKEDQEVIHKVWLEENNEGKQVDIEFYCPETAEENENFINRIDDMLKRIELMNYFRGIQ